MPGDRRKNDFRVDVKQLRYFVAIVQNGSISRASGVLNVAQPALGRHIQNMERAMGVPLLLRTPRGVQATDAGTIFLRHAKIILTQLEDAEREIRGSTGDAAGEVRLGLPGTISQILGVPLVTAARSRYPRVTLRIAEAMSGYVLDWLRLGRVDLGLLFNVVDDKNLRSIALLSETLVLLGPTLPSDTTPMPDEDEISFQAVAALPLILPSAGHGLRDLIDDRAAALDVPLRTSIDIDAYGAIKTLVEQGLGYSILPANAVWREVGEGRLRTWSIAPAMSRTVHLVLPIDRPLSQATRAIEGLCRLTLRDLVRSGVWHAAKMRTTA